MTCQTPFNAWLARMGELLHLGRPLQQNEAAPLIGISKNSALKYAAEHELKLTVALACAAVEAGLKPVE